MKRLIIFLIRRHLGLKLYEEFQFANQKSTEDTYYFAPESLIKIEWCDETVNPRKFRAFTFNESNVSLNWLLNDKCKIIKASRHKNDEY